MVIRYSKFNCYILYSIAYRVLNNKLKWHFLNIVLINDMQTTNKDHVFAPLHMSGAHEASYQHTKV